MTEEVIPYTRTGPATLNMFAPIPKTNPSGLNSMAGETIEFENPVIGIVEPPTIKARIIFFINVLLFALLDIKSSYSLFVMFKFVFIIITKNSICRKNNYIIYVSKKIIKKY